MRTDIKPGRLVWVPDDGERGIVLATSEDGTKVLVCFAAWKNGAEFARVTAENEALFTPPRGRRENTGWYGPHLLPEGTFICWFPIDDCVFDRPEPWDDRAGYCQAAYPEDERLLR